MEYKIVLTDESQASRDNLVALLEDEWMIENSVQAAKMRVQYVLKRIKEE